MASDLLVGVAGVVCRDGKYLLGSQVGGVLEGSWSFPWNLVSEGDFEPRNYVSPTVFSCTGLEVKTKDFIDIVDAKLGKEDLKILFYGCEYVCGEPKAVSERFSEWGWFFPDKLPKKVFGPVGYFFERVGEAKWI